MCTFDNVTDLPIYLTALMIHMLSYRYTGVNDNITYVDLPIYLTGLMSHMLSYRYTGVNDNITYVDLPTYLNLK